MDRRVVITFLLRVGKAGRHSDLCLRPPGNLSKTCTVDGWTEMHPLDIAVNCGYNLNGTSDDVSRLQLIRGSGTAV